MLPLEMFCALLLGNPAFLKSCSCRLMSQKFQLLSDLTQFYGVLDLLFLKETSSSTVLPMPIKPGRNQDGQQNKLTYTDFQVLGRNSVFHHFSFACFSQSYLLSPFLLRELQNSKTGCFLYKIFYLAETGIVLIAPKVLPRSPRDFFGGEVNKK